MAVSKKQKRQIIENYLKAIRAKEQLDTLFDSFYVSLKRDIKNENQEHLTEVFEEYGTSEILKNIADLYENYFTDSEVNELMSFAWTGACQKLYNPYFIEQNKIITEKWATDLKNRTLLKSGDIKSEKDTTRRKN